jgi:hypothetical protein
MQLHVTTESLQLLCDYVATIMQLHKVAMCWCGNDVLTNH